MIMPPRPPSELFSVPFEVVEPERRTTPLVFNSPHSGTDYPPEFIEQSCLDPHTLRRSEDCHVDRIFAGVTSLGAPLIRVHVPRAYLDLNREPYELDPSMFADRLPAYVNCTSIRVAGGLGTIPRLVSDTAEIYRRPLRFSEAENRIKSLYFPYHRLLANVLDESYVEFGNVVLIDCHSMPSMVATPISGDMHVRPDFVLGDRYGASCAPALTDYVFEKLSCRGFTVSRNRPYAGGHITQIHGRPSEGRHALQIEINRALYMDEVTLTLHDGFNRLVAELDAVVAALKEDLPRLISQERRLAAE